MMKRSLKAFSVRNSLKNSLKNQAGMGLVEVMVAAAILGGLSLVTMKVVEQGNQGVTRVEKGIDAADFDREVISFVGVKQACNQTVGTPTLASISGTNELNLTEIKNEKGDVVLKVGDKRGTVELVSMRLHSYDALTKTASLTKVFNFKLSAKKTVTKTKTSKISVTPDPTGINLMDCISTSSLNSGIWTVDDYGIFYDDKTVFIGRDGETNLGTWIDNIKLYVKGNMTAGLDHNIEDAGSFKQMVMLGGSQNTLYDKFPSAGNPLMNGAVIGGFQNKLFDEHSGLSSMNNMIGGGELNAITSTNHAAIVGGGNNAVRDTTGIGSVVMGGKDNYIQMDKETSPEYGSWEYKPRPYGSNLIGGGVQNQIRKAENSVILGGNNNFAIDEQSMGIFAGQYGSVSGRNSVLIGGFRGVIHSTGTNAAVVGGVSNVTSSATSALIAGDNNEIDVSSDISAVVASKNTLIKDNSPGSVIIGAESSTIGSSNINNRIIGGAANTIGDYLDYGTIIGGVNNSLGYGNTNSHGLILNSVDSTVKGNGKIVGGYASTTNADYAGIFSAVASVDSSFAVAIGGGNDTANANSIGTNASSSAIVGGFKNTVNCPQCFIVGGEGNLVTSTSTTRTGSFVLGGKNNTVSGSASGIGGFASIIGGFGNVNDGSHSSVVGGASNKIDTNGNWSLILGGFFNTIGVASPSSVSSSAIVSGAFNKLDDGAVNSVILGGIDNTISSPNSLAFGRQAYVSDYGSAVLKDDETESTPLQSFDTDSLTLKFKNGIHMCQNSAVSGGKRICNGGLKLTSDGKLVTNAPGGAPYSGLSGIFNYQAPGLWFGSQWFIGARKVLGLTGSGSLLFGAGSNTKMLLQSDGDLQIAGDLFENQTLSDERLKKGLTKLENVTEKIKKLNGYKFQYKKDNSKSIGVSAQELEKVYPELVYYRDVFENDPTKYRAVRYKLLPAILIEGFKEQQAQIEENQKMLQVMREGLDVRVEELEKEVIELRAENRLMQEKLEMVLQRLDKLEAK